MVEGIQTPVAVTPKDPYMAARKDWVLGILLEGGQLDTGILYHAKNDPQEVEDTKLRRRDGGIGIRLLYSPFGLEASTIWGFESLDIRHSHTRFDDAKSSDIRFKVKTSGNGNDLPKKIPATLFGSGKLTFHALAPPEKKMAVAHIAPFSFPGLDPDFPVLSSIPSILNQFVLGFFVQYIGSVTPKRIDIDDLDVVDTNTKGNSLKLTKAANALVDNPYYRSSLWFFGSTVGFDTHGIPMPLVEAVGLNATGALVLVKQTAYFDFKPDAEKAIKPFLNDGENVNAKGVKFDERAGWGTLGLELYLNPRIIFTLRAFDILFAAGRTKIDFSYGSLNLAGNLVEF